MKSEMTFAGEYIDLGENLNTIEAGKKKAAEGITASLFMDDGIKTAEAALLEAKKILSPYWLNSSPLVAGYVDDNGEAYLFFLEEYLKKKVLLLDFWDHTIPYSHRALPILKDWHRKYHGAGLEIIGVHCSTFPFADSVALVKAAVKNLDIKYPIYIDHDFALWRAVNNRYWPRRVLVASSKEILCDQVGTMGFSALEEKIQTALRQMSPGLPCPRIDPIQDKAEIHEGTTPFAFFGTRANQQVDQTDQPLALGVDSVFQKRPPQFKKELHKVYLDGPWSSTEQSIYLASGPYNKGQYAGDARISIRFKGTTAFLLAGTRQYQNTEVGTKVFIPILIDGKPVKDSVRGHDLIADDLKKTGIQLFEPRLCELFKGAPCKEYDLDILIPAHMVDNFEAFALFFSK